MTPGVAHIYTPAVLVEREHQLAGLAAAAQAARAGEGTGIAVTGESGAGKSALLDAAVADLTGLRVLSAHCDPLSTPRPLGPFRDLARQGGYDALAPSDEMLLYEYCERVLDALRTEPTVLVVEDLHWADAASIDVLRFLGRRIESAPLLMLLSYRDLEIGSRHVARPLLGDFARLDGLSTIALPALTLDGIRTLLDGSPLAPEQVQAATGGNAFFVTEIAKDPERPLPSSVRDAVLARTVDLTPQHFEVLQLIASAPDRLDDRALPLLGIDLPTLRRLEDTALLGRATDGVVFRHDLARQAVESTIPPGGGPGLHTRLLDALEQLEPRDPAVLTHHAVAARDAARAVTYAREAADESVAAGSHTEAAAFLAIALDHLEGAGAGERAQLLLQLAFQQYMTSRLTEAIDNVTSTFPLWQEAGDQAGLSAAYEAVAIYEYYSARRTQAESHAERAAAIADEAGTVLPYGEARATRGYLAYHRSDAPLVQECLMDSGKIAQEVAAGLLELRTDVVASAAALAGGDTEARARLLEHCETARTLGWDELASTVYSNVAYLDVEHGRFRAAGRILEESLPFTFERDIPICRHWQTGVRSRMHFARGLWSAALEDASTVLAADGMPLATMWPLLVSALVPLRRGEDLPEGALDRAWGLAEQLDEPLRRLAVTAALAEVCWMTDTTDPRVHEHGADLLARHADALGAAWSLAHLASWLRRLDIPVETPGPVPEPYRLVQEGRYAEAADHWRMAGDPFAEAMTLTDSSDPDERVRGVKLLDKIGAVGTADRIRADLRNEGVGSIPPRPRASTRDNPAGLTNRQLDVARLVARNLSNAEIAERLYLSRKTVDHHVSAVLTKLALPNRRAVAIGAEELGLT